MVGRKFIHVSRKNILMARDKRVCEALALAVMIKSEFVNSIFVPKGDRHIKSFFKTTMPKYKRALKTAVALGFVRINEDGGVEALKLREDNRKGNVQIDIDGVRDVSGTRCRTTIKENEVKIEEAILLCRISQVDTLEDTKEALRLRHADTSDLTPQERADRAKRYRKALKVSKRVMSQSGIDLYEMTSEDNLDNPDFNNKGISMKALTAVCGRSEMTVRARIKSLVKKGKIIVLQSLIPVMVVCGSWNMYSANCGNDTDYSGGYLRRIKGSSAVYMQTSNIYKLVR